jgi:hypothetical protein
MTKQGAKPENRAAFWRRHVKSWVASSETAAAYARRHGLAVQSLYQAKHRLRREAQGAAAARPAFARVELRRVPEALAEVRPALRMRLPSGVVLEWASAPAMSELAALMHRESVPQ